MMHKIIRYILCFFVLGYFLPGADDVSAATESTRYISNRIKIQRPGSMATKQPIEGEDSSLLQTKEGVSTTETGEPSDSIAALSKEEQNEIFLGTQGRFFTRQGVDPFEPFMRVPEAEVSPAEQAKLNIRPPQTPLERYDVAQLKLTAILMAPGKTRALVEESSGKGYVINEGTYIGNKGGQVSKILKDRIVIEEKYLDVLGNVAVRDVEIKLRRGEE